jgi:hypothetical protein
MGKRKMKRLNIKHVLEISQKERDRKRIECLKNNFISNNSDYDDEMKKYFRLISCKNTLNRLTGRGMLLNMPLDIPEVDSIIEKYLENC